MFNIYLNMNLMLSIHTHTHTHTHTCGVHMRVILIFKAHATDNGFDQCVNVIGKIVYAGDI